jgi:hypothetical protein
MDETIYSLPHFPSHNWKKSFAAPESIRYSKAIQNYSKAIADCEKLIILDAKNSNRHTHEIVQLKAEALSRSGQTHH